MRVEDAKIYGVCLQRLHHQIGNVHARKGGGQDASKIILESYCTSDIDEIIDILELYDIGENTPEGLQEKLDDLAYTVSVLVREHIEFGYNEEGHLGIFLILRGHTQVSIAA